MNLQFRDSVIFSLLLLSGWLFPRTPHIQFTHLSVDQGLSQSTVFCILQDQYAFMWFGTEDGLNRSDGYHFEIFKNDPADSTTLSSNFVTGLCQDSIGQIWIGTIRGICRFNPVDQKFYRYDHLEELKDYYIYSICADSRQNKIWIATLGNGFGYLDIKTEKYCAFKTPEDQKNGLISNNGSAIFQDRSGALWVGSKLGFQKFNPEKGIFSETHLTEGPSGLLLRISEVSLDGDLRQRFR